MVNGKTILIGFILLALPIISMWTGFDKTIPALVGNDLNKTLIIYGLHYLSIVMGFWIVIAGFLKN